MPLLLANINFTTQSLLVCQRISDEIITAYTDWLVNPNMLLNQNHVDELFSLYSRYCDTVITSEDERVNRNQRILLRCENDRLKERKRQIEDKQQTIKKVVDAVSRAAKQMLLKKLLTQCQDKIYGSYIPMFDTFASFAYGNGLTFSKLSMLTSISHPLATHLTDMATDLRFGDRQDKALCYVDDPKVAIGLLGVEKCRQIFPLLMARPVLKWSDSSTRLMAAKMWQHMMVTANGTRLLLEKEGIDNSDSGILIGVIRTLGYFLAANHFPTTFEDALVAAMLKYREADRREEYYACADVALNSDFLPQVIIDTQAELVKNLLQSYDWPANADFIKDAILEDIENIPLCERSVYGVALAQAKAFSIYDLLSYSGAFNENHRPYWFANVQLANTRFKEFQLNHPGKVVLRR